MINVVFVLSLAFAALAFLFFLRDFFSDFRHRVDAQTSRWFHILIVNIVVLWLNLINFLLLHRC
jgi:hypothetical protein